MSSSSASSSSSANKQPNAVWHSNHIKIPQCLVDNFTFADTSSGLAWSNQTLIHFDDADTNDPHQNPAHLWFIVVASGSSGSRPVTSGVKGSRIRTLFIPDPNKNECREVDGYGPNIKDAVLRFAKERLAVAQLRDNLRNLRHVVSKDHMPQTTDDIVSMVADGEQMVSGDVMITNVVMAVTSGPLPVSTIAKMNVTLTTTYAPQPANALIVFVTDVDASNYSTVARTGSAYEDRTVHLFRPVAQLTPEQTAALWTQVETFKHPMALVLPVNATPEQVEQMVMLAIERSRTRRATEHKTLKGVLTDIDTNCNALNVNVATMKL